DGAHDGASLGHHGRRHPAVSGSVCAVELDPPDLRLFADPVGAVWTGHDVCLRVPLVGPRGMAHRQPVARASLLAIGNELPAKGLSHRPGDRCGRDSPDGRYGRHAATPVQGRGILATVDGSATLGGPERGVPFPGTAVSGLSGTTLP